MLLDGIKFLGTNLFFAILSTTKRKNVPNFFTPSFYIIIQLT